MDNENKVEEVVTKETKKTSSIFFTIFACLMTGVVVFLATNIGQKASKAVNPDTNTQKCEETSNKESNVTSNVDSNSNSNVVSNVTSNVTSNTTSNVTSNTTPTTKFYKASELEGIYEYTDKNKTVHVVELFKEGLFDRHVEISGPGCPSMLKGNYVVEGNKITLYGITSYHCSCEGEADFTVAVGTINGNKITINNEVYTKSKQKLSSTGKEELESVFSCIQQGATKSEE